MATLVQNAVRIKETFDDIYDAIIEKGVTPTGGITTYADAIDFISSEGSITPSDFELSQCVLYAGSSFKTTSRLLVDSRAYIISSFFSADTTNYNNWTCIVSGYYYISCICGPYQNLNSYAGCTTTVCVNDVSVVTAESGLNYIPGANNLFIHLNEGEIITCICKGNNRAPLYYFFSVYFVTE